MQHISLPPSRSRPLSALTLDCPSLGVYANNTSAQRGCCVLAFQFFVAVVTRTQEKNPTHNSPHHLIFSVPALLRTSSDRFQRLPTLGRGLILASVTLAPVSLVKIFYVSLELRPCDHLTHSSKRLMTLH